MTHSRARLHRAVSLVLGLVLALPLGSLLSSSGAQNTPTQSRAASTAWAAFPGNGARLSKAGWGHGDRSSAVARPGRNGRMVLWRKPGVRPGAKQAGGRWRVRVWVHSTRRQRVTLRVFERTGSGPVRRGRASRVVPRGRWTLLQSRVRRGRAGSAFGTRIAVPRARRRDRLAVDHATVRRVAHHRLSNGCGLSRRGVPRCGTLLGAAHGGNTDPAGFERSLGHRLGVRRTYFSGDQVDYAVRTARTDLAAGRLPWISFKLPRSWGAMDSSWGASWARRVARRLSRLDGPVWIAFHHEPEYDGNIRAWKRMQERLIPAVRNTAPNVAFTVVMTGWHQLYGDSQFRLSRMFPRGKVDVAGFDVYNQYGVVRDGRRNTKGTDVDQLYFRQISRWAKRRGVAWGLAETGYSDRAVARYPGWIQKSYRALRSRGGVAFSYFDTTLNSIADWDLSRTAKRRDFQRALRGAPRFPRW